MGGDSVRVENTASSCPLSSKKEGEVLTGVGEGWGARVPHSTDRPVVRKGPPDATPPARGLTCLLPL